MAIVLAVVLQEEKSNIVFTSSKLGYLGSMLKILSYKKKVVAI